MKRLLSVIVAALVAGGVVLGAGVVGGGGGATSTAKASGPVNGLFAYVVPSNRGPLPGCSATDTSTCTAQNSVQWYVHVINTNSVVNVGPSVGARPQMPNAFVLNSIDERAFVNGVLLAQGTVVPPPNLTDRFASSGRFISTVSCGDPITTPCNTVLSPAVLPGENVALYVEGWFHTDGDPVNDPNGILVFTFTIHGTLNGNPVDLNASAPPILETS